MITNRTEAEAAELVRLARQGVHPALIEDVMQENLYRVQFDALSMNQKSQAYGDYREQYGVVCSYSRFVEDAQHGAWNLATGKRWMMAC